MILQQERISIVIVNFVREALPTLFLKVVDDSIGSGLLNVRAKSHFVEKGCTLNVLDIQWDSCPPVITLNVGNITLLRFPISLPASWKLQGFQIIQTHVDRIQEDDERSIRGYGPFMALATAEDDTVEMLNKKHYREENPSDPLLQSAQITPFDSKPPHPANGVMKISYMNPGDIGVHKIYIPADTIRSWEK